jgi:hypothetical protein
MKSNLLTLALLFFSYLTFAQGSDEIILSKENAKLLQELRMQETQRLARVQAFLINNPNVNASLSDDINTTYIYDVINGSPIYKTTDNLNAARGTKTTHLQTGGSLGLNLDGSNMTVGVWDGGPAFSAHVEFTGTSGSRITIIDNATVDGDTGFSSHGTHVTGTISSDGSSNPNSRGMATNVNVRSYNWTNDEAEMVAAANNGANPILVSNHSYGVPIFPGSGPQLDAALIGAYTQDARDIDNISRNNPQYLIVASAGNSGSDNYSGGLYPNYDKLTTDKNAKNSLVIANANPSLDPFNFELTNLAINSGSSQGPTDDIRIKPDIAADGTNLLSTTPNNGYATFSGTSMSAPNTTGTLVLLQEYYNQLNGVYMNSSTLKGLVCHTSLDDTTTPGPDPVFGWGFLDARASAQTLMDANNSEAVVDELTLNNGETYTFNFIAQAGEKLSATICWTDMPGEVVANGVTNDPTPRLVNDLDVRLTMGANTFFPWRLDYSSTNGFSNSKNDNNVDNIERIDVEAPVSGVYTLTVTNKGTLQNVPFGPQTQDFSMIVTGNNLTLSTSEYDLLRNLSVYPNPSTGEFTISFQSNLNNVDNSVKVDVYDIRGRLVYNNNFTNSSSVFKETISLGDVKAGIYMVNISEGNRTTSHKLIIE